MRPFVLDMETSDPDDFLTLLLLLGHPEVDLRAVTVTPGTREQVGIVRWALSQFGVDIPVGSFNIDHDKNCVSQWHYSAYRMSPKREDAEPGWKILDHVLNRDTTLVTGAPLKNLGALFDKMPLRLYDRGPGLGRLFIQGGFAGEGVVPPEKQLEKFRGRKTCPSFNLGGDPLSVLSVLGHRHWFSDLRFVSKNVCHGVIYDQEVHGYLGQQLAANSCSCTSFAAPRHDSGCNLSGLLLPESRTVRAWQLIYQGMSHYLSKRPHGKALHDPLAAACAINPDIGEWAEVEIYREHGEWGSRLSAHSGVQIITGYSRDKFLKTLFS